MAEKFGNKIHFLLFAKERGFMNKQKKLLGRIVAFALALVMVCSSFGTSSISAYAAGSADDRLRQGLWSPRGGSEGCRTKA